MANSNISEGPVEPREWLMHFSHQKASLRMNGGTYFEGKLKYVFPQATQGCFPEGRQSGSLMSLCKPH